MPRIPIGGITARVPRLLHILILSFYDTPCLPSVLRKCLNFLPLSDRYLAVWAGCFAGLSIFVDWAPCITSCGSFSAPSHVLKFSFSCLPTPGFLYSSRLIRLEDHWPHESPSESIWFPYHQVTLRYPPSSNFQAPYCWAVAWQRRQHSSSSHYSQV